MTISERFLNEAKIGAPLSVMVGSKEIVGVVSSLDISTVQIRKTDGNVATVSLESISYFEFSESFLSPSIGISNAINESSGNKVQNAFFRLKERGDTFFEGCVLPAVKTYNDICANSKSKVKVKLMAINDSLDYAINQSHEKNPGDYKISENIGKLKRIIRTTGGIERKEAANMLGALYYQIKSDRMALSTYVDGDDYVSAFIIAKGISSKEDMDMFSCCHLVENTVYDHYVIKWLVSRMLESDDYSIFNKIVTTNLSTGALSGSISSLRAIVLANGINYDSSYDRSISNDTYNGLLGLINQFSLNKSNALQSVYEKKVASQTRKLTLSASVVSVPNTGIQKTYAETKPYSKVAKESNESTVNFKNAQNAELVEKDLNKAIYYYKKAIENKERLTGSIPNLVSLYVRLGMYDEALSVLDTSGVRYLDADKYLNLCISVYKAAKDIRHRERIKSTYYNLVQLATSSDRKTIYFLDEAALLSIVGAYNDAKKILDKTLDVIEGNRYYMSNADIKADRLAKFYITRCNLNIALNDYHAAQDDARMILQYRPENEFALTVLEGHSIEELQSISETIGVTSISEYIASRIEGIVLEDELKKVKSIKDGVFIGTVKDASRIIRGILEKQIKTSVNDEVTSNYYFAIAKMIRQILDRDEDINPDDLDPDPLAMINERGYQVYVAIGSYFYGNFRLNRTEIPNNFDAARYCLFESISIFQYSEKTHKCWAAATLRYIQSYFSNTATIKLKNAKIYYELSDEDYEKDFNKRVEKVLKSSLCSTNEEFVIGMIEMLNFNYRIKESVLLSIFNSSLSKSVISVLEEISNSKSSRGYSFDGFKRLWNAASREYDRNRKSFIRLIRETIESVFSVGELQDNYDKLNSSEFVRYLNPTDKDYYDELKRVFVKILRYNEIGEFDYKADSLNEANEIRNHLEELIVDNPTYISYQKLLSLLTKLQSKILKESSQLYGDSVPEITVKVAGNSSINDEIVLTPISLTNKANVQNADNVTVKIEGPSVKVVNDEQLSRMLLKGDGIAIERMVEFRVTPKTLEERVFSVNVTIQYQYKTSMAEVINDEIEVPLSIPLYNESEFKVIKNEYEPYRNGSEVRDKTMFYGRDKEIDSIIQQISDGRGNVLRGRCLALYGQTRTGKSSLLYHLRNKLRELDPEHNVIVNIGSLGEVNLKDNDITEFLYAILYELRSEINSKHPVLKQYCDDNSVVIDCDKLLTDPDRSQLYFNSVFKELNRLIEDNGLTYNIIIMIDEFTYIYDWIRKGTMTDRIMKFWKAFIQNNGLFAIIIGQDHMMKFVDEKQFTNDFGSTHLRKVTYLSEEDAKRLMYEPIMLIDEEGNKKNRFQEGALDRLYELTAGSAFLIMNLCAGLVDYLNQIHSVYITRAHVDDYLNNNLSSFEESRFFEPQYDDKSEMDNGESNEENKIILHRIAQLSNKKEWTPLSSVVKNERDEELIKSLQQRDVIVVSNNERCKIKVGLYKEWIIEKFGVEGQR